MAALGTRLLQIEIDGTERSAEVSDVRIKSAESDSDFVTFANAAAGGARTYQLTFTGVQDTEADTLWDMVWSHAGEELACTLMPNGNATPSSTQPHFTFTAVVAEGDGDLLGGEADASATARFTFEAEWELLAKPTKVTS